MSNFPNSFDDDSVIPAVFDDITEIGGMVINALRDSVFAMQQNTGLNAQGSTLSIAERLGVSLNPDGTIKSSALTSLGLVTLPITENQIAVNANIPESKLRLDHRTQDLFNYITDLSSDINTAIGWINVTGIKLDPHLSGVVYRHNLSQIDVGDPSQYLKNKFKSFRDNTNAYTAVNDLNLEFLDHQWADGSPASTVLPVVTKGGGSYPSNYAHSANGVFINTSRFTTIPQTANDLQLIVDFIDDASIFLLGTRIQNLYSNGIPRVSRSSSLSNDGYGSPIVPPTPAIAYLLNTGTASAPVDDINNGDDIIEFKPSSAEMSSNNFDSQFALVKPGDIVRINYGTVEVAFVIKEKKYAQSGPNKKYIIRIVGKNIIYTTNASVRIDRPLVNDNKYGVLSMAAANNSFLGTPSLIVGTARGAQALGLGFDPDLFDNAHYLLYLAIYPTGSPLDGYTILPGIDVTGNTGNTPGKYTLNSIVEATNTAFRQNGFNYRFIAFSYQGEFGIMLADSINNTGFSILNAVVADDGSFSESATNIAFPNNAIGIFGIGDLTAPDPLGFGPNGSAISSPSFKSSFATAEASQIPTKLFLPLKRNNFYVNGVEKEKLNIDVLQSLDGYGDGYWVGTITSKSIFPGSPPSGRVQVTYRIPLDLSDSKLAVGKTIVVQSYINGTLVDFGRFIIQDINNSCPPNPYTDITVYDAVHGTGLSPSTVADIGTEVSIYFSSDSVTFNNESATDISPVTPFKRHFEVYVDQNGNTFSHERARFSIGGNLVVNSNTILGSSNTAKFNIIKVSPKLKGYTFGSVTKVTLHIISVNALGVYSAVLGIYDGFFKHPGPTITGRVGEVVRFYDETNIDYVDVILETEDLSVFSNDYMDIQLFPTLSLDDEIMLIGTCQLNDTLETLKYLRDERQFGNTSEKDFTTSALDYISLPEKLLHSNGVIRGFELSTTSPTDNPNDGQIYLKGGVALVNGKIIQVNNGVVNIPILKEVVTGPSYFNIRWAVCINDKGEYQPIPILDQDTSFNPLPTNRLLQVFNPATSTNYFIDAVTFTELIENRKDLTLLYLVKSIVNFVSPPTTISLTVSDARKYVADGDSDLPIVLTADNVQGNFKSLDAVLNWINFNTPFNAHVMVRGVHEISTQVTFDFRKLNRPIIFEGDGGVFNINIDQGIILGSYITFKNIKFVYKYASTPVDLVDSSNGMIYATIGNSQTISNITIEDCIFEVNNVDGNKFSYICILMTDVDSLLKDVLIKSNRFKTQLATEYHSAISIVTNNGSGTGSFPLLNNVIISDNVLDSEQSIIITSDVVTYENSPGLSCVNTKILNNICGGIGTLTTSIKEGVTGKPESNSLLFIENNTCKYIYTAGINGRFVEVFTLPSSNNLTSDTGNVVIQNNKCAFIHYGIRAVDLSNTMLRITGNILISNIPVGTAHTSDYINNFGYPSGGIRYAIYVSAGTFTGNLSNNTIINDNIVMGNFDVVLTTGYESYIRMESSGSITNNKLQGILSAPGSTYEYSGIIYDGYGSSIISHNNIARKFSNIFAYVSTRIDLSGLVSDNYAQVVDNIFDNSTTDGLNELTGRDAAGNDLSIHWMFERNKNQIKTVAISLSDGANTLNHTNSDYLVYANNPLNQKVQPIFNFPPGSYSTSINLVDHPVIPAFGPNLSIVESTTVFQNYFKYFSVDSRLPSGVRVISVKSNFISAFPNFQTSPNSTFTLVLVSNAKNDDVIGIPDFYGVKTATVGTLAVTGVDGPGTVSNATLSTSINSLEILPATSDPYKTGANYSLGLYFNIYYARDAVASSSNLVLFVSPIKIKFMW